MAHSKLLRIFAAQNGTKRMETVKNTIVPPEMMAETVRKVVEITDTPIKTAGGRKLIRRVEKILMPNGRYRYPVTYIDMTPGFWVAPEDWAKDRVHGYEMEIAL